MEDDDKGDHWCNNYGHENGEPRLFHPTPCVAHCPYKYSGNFIIRAPANRTTLPKLSPCSSVTIATARPLCLLLNADAGNLTFDPIVLDCRAVGGPPSVDVVHPNIAEDLRA